MKTPSLIGGIGPESTIDYYRSIVTLWKEKTGEVSQPSGMSIKPLFRSLTTSATGVATPYNIPTPFVTPG